MDARDHYFGWILRPHPAEFSWRIGKSPQSAMLSKKTSQCRIWLGKIGIWPSKTCEYEFLSAWWYSYPSEKYELVNWDDYIPNIWENKIHVPNHQPVMLWNLSGHLMSLNVVELALKIRQVDARQDGWMWWKWCHKPKMGMVSIPIHTTYWLIQVRSRNHGFPKKYSCFNWFPKAPAVSNGPKNWRGSVVHHLIAA